MALPPCIFAAFCCDAAVILVLKRFGGRADVVDEYLWTPLHYLASLACWACRHPTTADAALTALLDCDELDPTAVNDGGDTAATVAACRGSLAIADRVTEEVRL